MHSFPYSSDNKRYHSFSYDTKKRYQTKVFKVGLNAPFTCPNRDGSKAYGGCTFCNALGSGDFQGSTSDDLMTQFEKGVAIQKQKWPNAKAIAYFQAFTNTYASLNILKDLYEPFIHHPDVIALSIATRMDCLDDDTIQYLESMCSIKDVYLELGLQSIHEKTEKAMNRQEDFESFKKGFERLKNSPLKSVIHLMNGYPNETHAMMIESAQEVGKLQPYGVKIHMLNVLKNSTLGKQYEAEPFPLLSQESYISIVLEQLAVLPPEVVILRLTGDGLEEELIEPTWILNKIDVLNGIDKAMAAQNRFQGDRL